MTTRPSVWLESPLSSALGTISMAGILQNNVTIPIDRMRILGQGVLVFVLAGKAFYQDGRGRDYSLRPGDLIRVPADLPHAYGSRDGEPWAQAYVVFQGPQFDLLESAFSATRSAPLWHLEPVELWRNRLEEVFLPPSKNSSLDPLRTMGRFVQLLIEMRAMDASARQSPDTVWLEESMRRLGGRQEGTWANPRDVAGEVGMSYESFRKRFAANVGQPPARYQLQRRIDLACAAIYRGADNLKELAEDLGFCDIYHFSKAFRQHMGEPPSAYRKRVRGG